VVTVSSAWYAARSAVHALGAARLVRARYQFAHAVTAAVVAAVIGAARAVRSVAPPGVAGQRGQRGLAVERAIAEPADQGPRHRIVDGVGRELGRHDDACASGDQAIAQGGAGGEAGPPARPDRRLRLEDRLERDRRLEAARDAAEHDLVDRELGPGDLDGDRRPGVLGGQLADLPLPGQEPGRIGGRRGQAGGDVAGCGLGLEARPHRHPHGATSGSWTATARRSTVATASAGSSGR
jgi:hypothetical protein